MTQGILGTAKGNEMIWTAPSGEGSEAREVFFGLGHFCSYRTDDLKARNILIGLIGAAEIRRNEIAEAFGVNRCLVCRYTKELKEKGVEGLVREGRGRNPKVKPEMARYVREKFRKLYGKRRKDFTPKLIDGVKDEFGEEVSREIIRQIIKPVRDEIKEGKSGKVVEDEGSLLPVVRGRCTPVLYDGGKGKRGILLERLEAGFYSRYAGGLLLNIFIAKLTEGVFQEDEEGRVEYGLKTFVLMVMQMVQFEIVNIERVKRIYRKEFGVLVGKEKSPALLTMRRKLEDVVKEVDADGAMMRLADNYIKHLAAESDTFYIDDHFDPYWGQEDVLKGFSHVYDRPMEGTEHGFVHDAAGNPLFFGLRDCYHSFNEVLPQVASKLKKLVGEKRRIRLVFDRGGYDKKVFNKLGGMGMYYEVWAKGDQTKYEELDLEYEEEEYLFRYNVPDKPRRVKMGIAEVPFEGDGRGCPRRKIVLRRRCTRRAASRREYMYSSFVTNDTEATKRELTHDMIFRWRQECDFKIESNEFGIDQITSYLMKGYKEGAHEDIKDMPTEEVEGKLADNPQLKPFRRRKRQIKTEVSKIDEELGKRAFDQCELDLRTVAQVSLKRKNAELLRQRKNLISEMEEIKTQMKALPKKVKLLDLLKEREVKRFDFRKKLLMDVLKVTARNARRMALGLLDKYYKNYRDQLEFLRRLIRSGGHVKMKNEGLVTVTLTPMNTDKENRVAQAFLKEINKMKPVLFDTENRPIKFRLGR